MLGGKRKRGHPRTGIFISCAQAFDPFLGKCPKRREEGNLIFFRFVGIHVENYAAYVLILFAKHVNKLFFSALVLAPLFQQNSDFPAEAEGGNRFLPRPMFVVYWASRFQEEERAFPPSQSSPPFFWWSKV